MDPWEWTRTYGIIIECRSPSCPGIVNEDVQRLLARAEFLDEPIDLFELLHIRGERDA